MLKYDVSDQTQMVREYLGTKVYMASHPRIRTLFRGDKRPTDFGDRVWDSTLGMMRYLNNRSYRSVLDVGCGWGILGIHLARTSGARLTSVDADPNLEAVVQAHAELNGVHLRFKNISFGDLDTNDLACDLVMGAEICYSETVAQELRAMVDHAVQSKAKEILIADLGRPDFDTLCDHCTNCYGATVLDLQVPGVDRPRKLLSIQIQ